MSDHPDVKLQLFYITGIAEALSSLILFFVAMPLKYIWDLPEMVSITGMIHGILFLAYVGLGFYLTLHHRWKWKWFVAIFIGSIIPFGPFVVDYKIARQFGYNGRSKDPSQHR